VINRYQFKLPIRDFGPHVPSRNLGTASSRSKPCHTMDGGDHPRCPPGFAAKSWKTMTDYGHQAREIMGIDRSQPRQNPNKTEHFRSSKRRFLRVC
jgi:hypothetical protein